MAAPELFQFRGAFAGGTMRIEYEDKEIIVVYKEAGLPVQSGRTSAKDLVSMLKNHLAQEEQTAREPYLGIVHRLDQPVEGVLVFAKTPKAAADLSRQAAAKSDAGNSAGQDLAALRDVLAELRRILVVDLVIFAAENTDLLFSVEAASLLERSIFSVKSHFQSPPVKTAQSDYVKGSSSSMPSGMFINPSIEAEFWPCGACGAGADGAALCCP